MCWQAKNLNFKIDNSIVPELTSCSGPEEDEWLFP